jgi:hypothetical protein
MKRLSILSVGVVLLAFAIGCHNHDPGPSVCRPRTLQYDTDSIVYKYDDNGRVSTVQYFSSGRQSRQDDFGYGSSGRIVTIAKSSLALDGTPSIDSNHTISWGGDGLPANLVTDSYSGHFTTKFTHDDQKRLSTAETSSGFQQYFVGSTRYEYDDNGNIPKVYYTLNFNQQVQEVLARENLTFDDKEKFYINTPELKIANEYVYGYLPDKNNCLTSKVYFYSYAQHFVQPQEVSFTAAYNDQGLIKTLKTDGDNGTLYSGEVLFNNILYSCN